MANDTFTEVSSQGWFSRIGSSIKGIFVGFILIALSFVLLFWNEGRAIKRFKTLEEGGGAVVSVNPASVNLGNDGQLVHLSGHADTQEILTDDEFSVSSRALKLTRTVQMFQWQEESSSETKKKIGGGTETVTTYDYKRSWSNSLVDSSRFQHPEGHRNPASMPFTTTEFIADSVTLGSFTLSPSLIARINNEAVFSVEPTHELPEHLGEDVRPHSGGFFVGKDPAQPEIGDLKIAFTEVRPTDVSIVAKQVEHTFEPYRTSAGGTIELLQLGVVSAEQMFQQAQQSNKIMTWVLRAVGFFMMFIGFRMVLAPLAVVADVLPIAGTIVGAGIGIVSFLTSSAFSFLTIAFAWIFFRPFIGVTLLALVVVLVIFIVRRFRKVDLPPLPVSD